MKKLHFITIAALFSLALIITACGNVTTPTQPAAETQPVLQPSATAIPPEPTQTIAPTAIPPVPCMITFDSDRDKNREIYLMGPEGKYPVNLSNDPGEDFDPAWSPDGSHIAFVSNRANGQEKGQFIYVMDANGNDVRLLSTENDSNFPDWSHDGSRITFTHQGDIYVINADGSGTALNMTKSLEEDSRSTWSPDGSKIAWLSGKDGNWNILVMYADGSNVKQLTDDGKVTDVAWTIDNQIFAHWDNPNAGCMNCVMNADGSNVTNAGGKGEIQRYLPFWTWDGNRVELADVSLNGGDDEIYLVSEIYPDIFLNLTNNPAQDRNADWPANCGPGTAPTTPETRKPKDPKEVVLGYAGDDQWQQQRKENFQKACDELGIRCLYGETRELIEKGVDAIVQNSNAIVVAGLHPDILSARDKGIPIFVLDAETSTEGAYNITIDQREWARISLEWMFEKIGGQGQFTYFDLAPLDHYADTIQEMLAKYPGITVAEYRDGMYEREKIKPETVDFMKTYPELKAVWTSYNNVQALWGMEESGIPQEKWPVLNCEANRDGLETWMKMKTAHPNFDCIAVANPPGIAYDAVYAAFYLVTGAKLDETALGGEDGRTLFVDPPVVTNENLQEWLKIITKENANFVDERMKPEKIKEKWFIE